VRLCRVGTTTDDVTPAMDEGQLKKRIETLKKKENYEDEV